MLRSNGLNGKAVLPRDGRISTMTSIEGRMLIGGEWANRGKMIPVFNPVRPNEVVGTIPCGMPGDVNDAVAAAKKAQPAWAAKTYSARAEILARGLDRLATDIEERAVLYVRENGKTMAEAKGELTGLPVRQRLTLE